ncbi:hypothetical protein pipiens_008219 [Culex pipiens pipiens]|uniref:DDE-1 domain-containing protein n=1 Tax=Culex pipiens pipiens TaxID=38569 RepID=A0ABD1DM04_CULPP
MKAVRERRRGVPLRKVAKKYGLSKSSLQRLESKLKKDPNCVLRKRGGQPALSGNHEANIVKSLIICAEWGYPLSTFDLRCFVKTFLDKNGMVVPKFRDNFPGYDWAAGFLRRHEATLSKRLCQNTKRNRARVSSTTINSFLDEYELTSEGIPAHLKINYDESAWATDPGRKKLIFKRGCWADAFIFADWFKSVIIPYCRRFEGSKLLIGDNLSSHLSPEVVGLCEANQVKFTFLPANSTHLTQPLDVSLFRPMKGQWRQVLETNKMKSATGSQAFEKKHFPRLLRATLEGMDANLEKDIISGFVKCGLAPVNRKKVLARLPQGLQQEVEDENVTVNDSLTEYLKLMRYGNEGEPQKGRKKKLNMPAGRSVTSADFQPATLNDVAGDLQDADTLSEGEQDELNDLGELGEPGPEADCALSEDEQDELGENDDELDNVDTLNELEPGVGSWVLVKFVYGKRDSRHIGKITSKAGGDYLGSFLRKSTKKSDIFVFPDVSDERAFASQDVKMTLKEPSARRGRYSFEPNPLI